MDFIIGGLAGVGATFFTNPIDVAKTRMQLQGELRARKSYTVQYRNMMHALYVIAVHDGLLALQKGLVPALILGFVLNGIRLGIYRIAEQQGWTKNSNGVINFPKAVFWSGIGGLIGGVIANPTYVVKTRLQAASNSKVAVGKQHNYKSMTDAFVSIYKTEGLTKGLFGGAKATGFRLGIGSSAQLTAYSTAKETLLSYGICNNSPVALSFAASAVGGIAVVIVACPLDVAAVRLYNQSSKSGDQRLYTGLFDAVRKIFVTEGFHGLYKGVGPLYFRVAPHTTLSLMIWDLLSDFYNDTPSQIKNEQKDMGKNDKILKPRFH